MASIDLMASQRSAAPQRLQTIGRVALQQVFERAAPSLPTRAWPSAEKTRVHAQPPLLAPTTSHARAARL
eukprot:1513038-Pleurochrysis_carterae.AAC.1